MKRITNFPALLITLSLLLMLSLSACEIQRDYSGAVESLKNGDHVAALKDFRRLALNGSASAQWRIGKMYEKGLGVSTDHHEAIKWYRKAAEQGATFAQSSLGNMYERGLGVSTDFHEAINWYRKAAKQGATSGQSRLGNMYEKGLGVSRDYREAAKWYLKAAEQGSRGGQWRLGRLYERGGFGVAKDYREALAWYRESAEQGFSPAKRGLTRVEAKLIPPPLAEDNWTAWARVNGSGRQPFFHARGSSAESAKRNAVEVCQKRSGSECSSRSASAGRCGVLRLRSGKELKPRDC